MRIEFADAERAALGVGRDGDPLHALQQGREEEHGGPHAGGEFAAEAAGIKGGVVEVEPAGGAVPCNARALFAEEGHELLDVGDVGHVAQGDLLVGEEGGADDGQRGVLVARGRDGAGERFAAVDDEIGHWEVRA